MEAQNPNDLRCKFLIVLAAKHDRHCQEITPCPEHNKVGTIIVLKTSYTLPISSSSQYFAPRCFRTNLNFAGEIIFFNKNNRV